MKTSLILRKNSKLKNWIPISLILLVAICLYFFQLGEASLWADEFYSIRDATKIFSNFPNNFSLNRPLYFVLLHFWMKLSTDEAWLRSLSVLFGLGSIVLTYLLGCQLYSKLTGLVAALLLTFSTLAIDQAQEVRMYMMSLCVGIAGSLILLHLLETFKTSYFISWLSLRFLAVLTTPINILLLVPDLLLLCYQFKQERIRSLKAFRKWFWLVGILVIPVAITLADIIPPLIDFFQEANIYWPDIPTPGIKQFVARIIEFTIWPLKPHSEEIAIWIWYSNQVFLYSYALLVVCLLVIGLLPKNFSSKYISLALWTFVPLVILFLLCQLVPKLWWRPHYFLLIAPYILLLLAEGFIQVFQWQRKLASLIIAIYLIAISGSLLNHYTATPKEDWRSIIQTININEQPKDAIILFPDNRYPALEYYYEGLSPIYTIKLKSSTLEVNKYQSAFGKTFREIDSKYLRCWLVIQSSSQNIQGLESVIPEHYRVQKYNDISQLNLYLLTFDFNEIK